MSDSHDDGQEDGTAPPQNEAGLDRAGTGRGGAPNATDAGRPDASAPTTERPTDQVGPIAADGSQVPPDPHVGTGDGPSRDRGRGATR